MSVPEPSAQQKVLTDAFSVFQANKYLDFKNKNELRIYLHDSLIQTTDVKQEYGHIHWEDVEQEDSADYHHDDRSGIPYRYTHAGGTMTEQYTEPRSMGIRHEVTNVYNSKGFLLLHQRGVMMSDRLLETRATTYRYDAQNRVVHILDTEENPLGKVDTFSAIAVSYAGTDVNIQSLNGDIRCRITAGADSAVFVSKKNSHELASAFMYLLAAKNFSTARKYCIGEAQTAIDLLPGLANQIEEATFVGGTSTFTADGVREDGTWTIRYSTTPPQVYQVSMRMNKTAHGWKIAQFEIKP